MAEGYLTLARVQAARGDGPAAEAALHRARGHARRLGAHALEQLVEHYLLQLPDDTASLPVEVPAAVAVGRVSLPEALSAREREVLRLVAAGASNQAIAEAPVISIGTVKGHLNHILTRLDGRSRSEAVARARAVGLLA